MEAGIPNSASASYLRLTAVSFGEQSAELRHCVPCLRSTLYALHSSLSALCPVPFYSHAATTNTPLPLITFDLTVSPALPVNQFKPPLDMKFRKLR